MFPLKQDDEIPPPPSPLLPQFPPQPPFSLNMFSDPYFYQRYPPPPSNYYDQNHIPRMMKFCAYDSKGRKIFLAPL